MQEEWDKLTEAEREAFKEWNQARKTPPAPKYGDMTAAQRAAFHRKVGVPLPVRGIGR